MIRLTMTQIRVALLGGNLALTVLLGYLVASRFMAPTEGVRAAEAVKLMRKDPDECRASKTSHGTSKGLERRHRGHQISNLLETDEGDSILDRCNMAIETEDS